MIKRILVPLDPSPFAEAAVEVAGWLAQQHGAEVAGLVILDVPGITRSVGPVPIGGLYYAERAIAAKEERAEFHIRALLEKFSRKCQAAGIAHVEAERQGSPSSSILQESLYYDCLVIGLRTYFDFETGAGADREFGTPDDRSGRSLEQITGHSAVPILAAPMGWSAPDRVRALIAVNDSLASVRALHAFVQLFRPDSCDTTLFTCCEQPAEGELRLSRAEAFLHAHGFSSRKHWSSTPIRQTLNGPDFAAANLVVLGAHSKLAVIDFMVGSVCKDLIDQAAKPLLIGP